MKILSQGTETPQSIAPSSNSGAPVEASPSTSVVVPFRALIPQIHEAHRLVRGSGLPGVYVAAQKALQQCASVDECKEWADKAAALASYAKQARDESLMNLSKRIHARAVRRCGLLLQQVKSQKGGDRGNSATGPRRPVGSRKAIAQDAGLSDRQRKTALRVAAMPEKEFEVKVERPKPATIKELVQPAPKTQRRDPEAQPAKKEAAKNDSTNAPVALPEVLQDDFPPDVGDTDYADDNPQQRWIFSCSFYLGQMLAMRAYWSREFGDWWKFEKPSTLITLIEHATEEWAQIAQILHDRRQGEDQRFADAVRKLMSRPGGTAMIGKCQVQRGQVTKLRNKLVIAEQELKRAEEVIFAAASAPKAAP